MLRLLRERPAFPYSINWKSKQARGLVAWWPLAPLRDARDFGPSGLYTLTNNGPVWNPHRVLHRAPLFDDASSQFFSLGSAVLTAPPFTMGCWFESNDITAAQSLMQVSDTGSTNNFHLLELRGQVAGDFVGMQSSDSTGGFRALTTTGFLANTLHHAVGVVASATDRRVFIDGGSKGTESTSVSPTGLDTTAIGALIRTTNAVFMSGFIGDCRIYNRALTDIEIQEWFEDPWDLILPDPSRISIFTGTIDVTVPVGGPVTSNNLLALLHFLVPIHPSLPVSADGIDQADQQQLLWGYPGILWGVPPAAVSIVPWLRRRRRTH